VGLGDRWAYHDAHTDAWHGPAGDRALELCRTSDIVLNLSGMNPLRPWVREVPVRVIVDTDPAFTQVRHLAEPAARERAAEHTAFFSFAELIGDRGGSIPDDGFPWQPTRQPVVLDAWPVTPGPRDGHFTTVMQWDSYAVRELGGRRFGMKSASFDEFVGMPQLAAAGSFELALGSASAPRDRLRSHGWIVRDPMEVTRDPWAYQRYIQGSKAEFTVAKHGYVVSRSGWFSERSAAYLASGRPVITQETGFSRWLPSGEGVLAFSTPAEAVAAIADVSARYAQHCRAARGLAEAYFDSAVVLVDLLARAMGDVPRLPDASVLVQGGG
jgi:hypothetical protein